jgi:hypothetical protein
LIVELNWHLHCIILMPKAALHVLIQNAAFDRKDIADKVYFSLSLSETDPGKIKTRKARPKKASFQKDRLTLKLNDSSEGFAYITFHMKRKPKPLALAQIGLPLARLDLGKMFTASFLMTLLPDAPLRQPPTIAIRVHLAGKEKPFKGRPGIFLDEIDKQEVQPEPLPSPTPPTSFRPFFPINQYLPERVKEIAKTLIESWPEEYLVHFANPFFIRACIERYSELNSHTAASNSGAVIQYLERKPTNYVSPKDVPLSEPYPPNMMTGPNAHKWFADNPIIFENELPLPEKEDPALDPELFKTTPLALSKMRSGAHGSVPFWLMSDTRPQRREVEAEDSMLHTLNCMVPSTAGLAADSFLHTVQPNAFPGKSVLAMDSALVHDAGPNEVTTGKMKLTGLPPVMLHHEEVDEE